MAAGAIGIFQGILGASAQSSKNQAIQDALQQLAQQQQFYNVSFADRMKLLSESQTLQMQGLLDSIPLMRRQAGIEYGSAAGAARAAIAESGAAFSGSKADLLSSIDVQGLLNQRTLESNIRRELQQSDLNYRSALFGATQSYYAQQFQINNARAGLQAQMGSEFLTGLSAGIGGFGTGLSIVTGVNQASKLKW